MAVTTLGFIINFRIWCNTASNELKPRLNARLASATLRLISFFTVLLLTCWLTNIAVWTVFLFLVAIAVSGAMIGGDAFAVDLAMVLTGGILREWCFGFPQMILHPQPDLSLDEENELQEIIGRKGETASVLRPGGKVTVDGEEYSAVSENGTLIEKCVPVEVVDVKNGAIVVKS